MCMKYLRIHYPLLACCAEKDMRDRGCGSRTERPRGAAAPYRSCVRVPVTPSKDNVVVLKVLNASPVRSREVVRSHDR
jgi:hypothetical protein